MGFVSPSLKNTTSEEDVHCIIIMNLLLRSQCTNDAWSELFLGEVCSKFLICSLHDSVEFILMHSSFFRILAASFPISLVV